MTHTRSTYIVIHTGQYLTINAVLYTTVAALLDVYACMQCGVIVVRQEVAAPAAANVARLLVGSLVGWLAGTHRRLPFHCDTQQWRQLPAILRHLCN